MRTIQIPIYQINEHPNKEKCYQWIRDNWHDLNQHSVSAVVDSLKALQKEIGGSLDYSISQYPDRGDYIKLTDYDTKKLQTLNADELSLTGVCWDKDVIEGIEYDNAIDILNNIYAETTHVYSDEGLRGLCEANEYEFTVDGEIWSQMDELQKSL